MKVAVDEDRRSGRVARDERRPEVLEAAEHCPQGAILVDADARDGLSNPGRPLIIGAWPFDG